MSEVRNYILKLIPWLIPLMWILLFRKTIFWIAESYIIYENRFGVIVLLAVLLILSYKIKKSNKNIREIIRFQPKRLTLTISTVSFILYLSAEYFIDMNIVSSVIFGAGTYGIIGLYISKKYWLKGLIPVILIIQTLPFGIHLDTYLGFPLRIFTTEAVQSVLSGFDISNLQNETILIIENRAANIDLSCSGMKGIWSGSLFFFALIWLEQKRINLKLFLSFFLFIGLLVIFNILRVTLIVFLDTVYNLPETAKILHVPLGIIGFIFSILIVYLIIKNRNKTKTNSKVIKEQKSNNLNQKTFKPAYPLLLLFLISLGNFMHLKKTDHKTPNSEINIALSEYYNLSELKLTEEERSFLLKNQNDKAVKYKFQTTEFSGSLLLSITEDWKAHHKPELCLTSSGLSIDNIETVMFDKDFQVKRIDFKNKEIKAYYWFQSNKETTFDFSSRIWKSLTGKQKKWTLVSIIINKNTDSYKLKDFINNIKEKINNNYETSII